MGMIMEENILKMYDEKVVSCDNGQGCITVTKEIWVSSKWQQLHIVANALIAFWGIFPNIYIDLNSFLIFFE